MKKQTVALVTVRNHADVACAIACGFSCRPPRWDSRRFRCSPPKAARWASRRPGADAARSARPGRARQLPHRHDASATRTETPLRDIPQFINIVPQALIRSQNATSLQDALRNVPGISYAAAEGGTQANQVFFLRGFPLNQDIFIDGVRDLGEYNRDLFATESVEVLKGSSALMFGRGSTGGVINQIVKVADRLERREVALTFGSFDQKRATADFNFRTGDDERGAARRARRGLRAATAIRRTSRTLRLRAELLGEARQRDRPHALLLLPQGRGRHRLRSAGAVHRGDRLLRLSAGVAARTTTATRTTTSRTTRRTSRRLRSTTGSATRCRCATRCAGRTTSASRSRRSRRSPRPTSTARRSRANTPLELLRVTRNHDTGRTRDNDDTALINQTELTGRSRPAASSTRCWPGSSSRSEKLDRAATTRSTRIRTRPACRRRRRSRRSSIPIRPRSSPTPRRPNLRLARRGRHRRRLRAGPDRVLAAVEGAARRALRALRVRARRRSRSAQASPAPARSRAPTTCVSGRAGLIWQPTSRAVVLRLVGQLVQPVGRARRLRRHGADQPQPDQPEPRPGEEPELRGRRAVGRRRAACSCARRSSATRRPMRAWSDATGTTVLAGKRRVDGIEFELAGSITPNWDIYSGIAFMDGEIVHGPGERAGQHAARRGRGRGQRLDGLPAAAAAGRSAAACAARTARGSPTRTCRARRSRATSCGTSRPPTCSGSTRCGSTSTTSSTRPTTSAATTTRRTACCPGQPLGRVGDAALQLPVARCCCTIPERARRRRRSRAFRARIDAARWVDGNVTSGHQSAQAKYNEQLPEESAEAREIGEEILAALARNPLFFSAALPQAGLSAAVQPLRGRA